MFGSTLNQPATTGGLFGTATATTTTPQTGGLFGSNSTAQVPTQGGGFGSLKPLSGNVFGQSTLTSSQAQPTASTTLNPTPAISFGSNAPTQASGSFAALGQQANATNVGGFGQANQNQSTIGTFGIQDKASQPQSSNTGAGLFGNSLLYGSSTIQPLNQQPQTIPGVLIDASNVRGTTRYNDLKEELQKQLMEIDTMIEAQIQLKNQCDAIMPAHEVQLSQIPDDVEFCRRKRIGVDNTADSDIHAISEVQKLIKSDAEAAKLSFAAIDMLRLPPQYHIPGVLSPKATNRGSGGYEDIVGFFSQTADELSDKLATFKKHLSEIEQHLRGVEANSAHQINVLVARKKGNSPAEESSFDQLASVLRDFETGLLNVAGKVGETRKGVTTLQLNQFCPTINNSRN
ncbi:Nucleoporin NUP49 [Erysiphe neolycopersici]|uniref:Nucleoporin NUP49 n=1 Tax=Erysiphe neolycopersici TaxID=212602 RepID=A0A420HUB9_9PEZI|nr:Nucleoporin NUP49 [Erysiphe neolycopersici]